MRKLIKVQKYQKKEYSSRLVLPYRMCKQLDIKTTDKVIAELDIENERIILKKYE